MKDGRPGSHAPRDARETPHVFGPVPSRRLGRSLGVDLTPRKVCSFDCIYCQVGRTTRKTTEREQFMAASEIIAEVRQKLKTVPRPDYITLSGSGEPTLHAGIGEIIDGIQRITDVPVAVMTNGSLFYDPEVRRACLHADLILPTLDAGDEETFQAINRPAAGLTLARVAEAAKLMPGGLCLAYADPGQAAQSPGCHAGASRLLVVLCRLAHGNAPLRQRPAHPEQVEADRRIRTRQRSRCLPSGWGTFWRAAEGTRRSPVGPA